MMNHDSDHLIGEMAIRRFIYGTCPDEEHQSIAQAIIEDPATAERVEVIEAQIADEYVRDLLSADERAGFEERIANSEDCRNTVEMSRALRDHFRHKRVVRRRWWIAAAACVPLLLIPVALKDRRTSDPVQQSLQPAVSPTQVIVWEVKPGLTRGSSAPANEFARPRPETVVEIRVKSSQPREAAARLESVEGAILWRGQGEPIAAASEVRLRIPGNVLKRNDYVLFVEHLRAFSLSVR